MAREFVVYRGEKFWIQTTGRYFQSGCKEAPERLLHRRIWVDRRGPVPEGHVVHHKNGDWRDNRIGNLECLPIEEHARQHMEERFRCDAFRKKNRGHLDRAIVAAAEWHRSAEGKEWHRGHGKRTWAKRKPAPATCTVCHAEFQTYTPKHTRFCSRACAQRGCYARQCTRPAVCAHCGKAFMANRYRVVTCCSRLCANRKRAEDRRVQPDA